MKPHKCPVCNGMGHIWTPPYIPGDQETYTGCKIESYPCMACNGTGIVSEETDCEISLDAGPYWGNKGIGE